METLLSQEWKLAYLRNIRPKLCSLIWSLFGKELCPGTVMHH